MSLYGTKTVHVTDSTRSWRTHVQQITKCRKSAPQNTTSTSDVLLNKQPLKISKECESPNFNVKAKIEAYRHTSCFNAAQKRGTYKPIAKRKSEQDGGPSGKLRYDSLFEKRPTPSEKTWKISPFKTLKKSSPAALSIEGQDGGHRVHVMLHLRRLAREDPANRPGVFEGIESDESAKQ